jgi:hypothetical protein
MNVSAYDKLLILYYSNICYVDWNARPGDTLVDGAMEFSALEIKPKTASAALADDKSYALIAECGVVDNDE